MIIQLIIYASISQNNEFYVLKYGTHAREVYTVITAQTKLLLLNEIAKAVEDEFGHQVPINAIPIVAAIKIFDKLLKAKTPKIKIKIKL